jgi:radical SAM protein with 4Fe4S-binding SPASM domain
MSLAIENFIFGKSSCGICKDIIGILPNGNIIACGAFIGSKEKEEMFNIGTIDGTSLNLSFINKLLNWENGCNECSKCLLDSRCRNDCMACNFDATGKYNCPSITNCEINKIFINESNRAIKKLRNEKSFRDYYLNHK